MKRLRLLVGQTRQDAARAAGVVCAPLPVGVVPWAAGRISIVIKATLSYAGSDAIQTATFTAEQEPLSLASPSDLRGAQPGELIHPSDFVTWKPKADVLLHGHAFGPRAAPRIDARVVVSGMERSFCLIGSPAERMPLSGGFLRAVDGESPTDPVGAAGPWATELDDELDDEGALTEEDIIMLDRIDAARGEISDAVRDTGLPVRRQGTSFAATPQRAKYIPSDAVIELAGLTVGGGRRVIQLPGLSPFCMIEMRWGDFAVKLECDTLRIDTDREILHLVWRGQAPISTEDGSDVRRLTVSLERDNHRRELGAIYGDLQRGVFSRAIEEIDLREPAPPEDDPSLRMAKYAEWKHTPEPTIEIEQYARISAEIGEKRETKAEVLRRHNLDGDGWALEERAWLERMGDAAMKGDGSLSLRYGALLIASQDALAGPGEAARTVDEYATIKVAMESQGTAEVLQAHSMTVPEWNRLDRRMKRQGHADQTFREEMKRRLQVARLRDGSKR
jgi:hypothetical protein